MCRTIKPIIFSDFFTGHRSHGSAFVSPRVLPVATGDGYHLIRWVVSAFLTSFNFFEIIGFFQLFLFLLTYYLLPLTCFAFVWRLWLFRLPVTSFDLLHLFRLLSPFLTTLPLVISFASFDSFCFLCLYLPLTTSFNISCLLSLLLTLWLYK